MQKSHIAIIGGGFSGAMTALHLLKQTQLACDITIIEPRSELGKGLAYSTPCENHLLNVTASRMSALPEQPEHFFNYAFGHNKNISPDSYVPRKIYGQYMNTLFKKELEERQTSSVSVHHIQAKVVDIETIAERYRLFLSDSGTLDVDCVVLALGNLAGNKPNWLSGLDMGNAKYIHNPWNTEAIDGISPHEKILFVGSGLTAVDKIIELNANGHKAEMYVLSRHGLLPRTHVDNYERPIPADLRCSSTLAALKTIRKRAEDIETGEWRQVIDALKSTTQEWWQSIQRNEQKRFLRHLQSYWDVHRHRMAPNIGHEIEALLKSGQLKLFAGRITSISETDESLLVEIKERGKNTSQKISVNKIINCTGPQSSLKTVDSQLLISLCKRGLVCPHDLGTGLAVRGDGQVLDNAGQGVKGLFAIGRLRKEELLESVAVPELREQALELAGQIVSFLSTSNN